MPYFMRLIGLSEQSERLADDIFELAVEANDNPRIGNVDKLCKVLEKALQRTERRKIKAGLIFK